MDVILPAVSLNQSKPAQQSLPSGILHFYCVCWSQTLIRFNSCLKIIHLLRCYSSCNHGFDFVNMFSWQFFKTLSSLIKYTATAKKKNQDKQIQNKQNSSSKRTKKKKNIRNLCPFLTSSGHDRWSVPYYLELAEILGIFDTRTKNTCTEMSTRHDELANVNRGIVLIKWQGNLFSANLMNEPLK